PAPAPAPAPAPTPAPAPAEDPTLWRVYTVESGDTLGDVSQRLLGTCKRWPEILEANKGLMKTDRDLREGMKIRVPPRDLPPPRTGTPQAPRPQEVPAASKRNEPETGRQALRPVAAKRAAASRKTHVVRRGETLYSLARKFYPRGRAEEAVKRMKAANDVTPTSLPVGKTLILPPLD
ncbi:MAG: LysM peptidoglycan-binding domain-containing protein, partial [Planctomycetes bacterium]|nr:LysM peptidoglycan-binding domain-containing protein [Planctomycetota bacterium]